MVPWARPSPQPLWYLDRYSRRRARYCDRQTDRPTDIPRYTRSVTIGRVDVRIALRCGLKIKVRSVDDLYVINLYKANFQLPGISLNMTLTVTV